MSIRAALKVVVLVALVLTVGSSASALAKTPATDKGKVYSGQLTVPLGSVQPPAGPAEPKVLTLPGAGAVTVFECWAPPWGAVPLATAEWRNSTGDRQDLGGGDGGGNGILSVRMSPGDAYETSTTTIQVGSATQLVTVTLTAVVDLPAGVCRFYAQALSD